MDFVMLVPVLFAVLKWERAGFELLGVIVIVL